MGHYIFRIKGPYLRNLFSCILYAALKLLMLTLCIGLLVTMLFLSAITIQILSNVTLNDFLMQDFYFPFLLFTKTASED